eukprot:m.217753 g.217753  ORF g.217753 m.217753 type:complete len:477 (-) comp19137_c0_seq2:451-1881(-)
MDLPHGFLALLLTIICTKPVHAQDITPPSTCDPNYFCASSEHIKTGNQLAIAVSFFGGLSVVACMLVVLVIFAHNKDRRSLRERIILGLMVSNLVYSVANIVPVWYRFEGENQCPHHSLVSVDGTVWTRGFWFFGKYSMVCYEILIMTISIRTLHTGVSSISWKKEVAGHVTCFAAGLIALLWWSIEARSITKPQDSIAQNVRKYHTLLLKMNTSNEVYTATCDSFEREQGGLIHILAQWATLLQVLIRVWLAPLILSLGLWIVSRFQYQRLVKEWTKEYNTAEGVWARELWATSDATELQRQQRLFYLRRDGYHEIVKPLEPYVIIFVFFAIPVIIISTNYCLHAAYYELERYCQLPCELVLATRSTATACIYFWDEHNRHQLRNGKDLCARLYKRIHYYFCGLRRVSANGASSMKRRNIAFKKELQEVFLLDEMGMLTRILLLQSLPLCNIFKSCFFFFVYCETYRRTIMQIWC